MITLIFDSNLCVGWGKGLRPAPGEQFAMMSITALNALLPSWRTNSSFLMLDANGNVTTQADKLDDVKQMALAELEFLFDRTLALGIKYDFGGAGVAFKAADWRSNGGTQNFPFTLEHPHSSISYEVDISNGYLHIQSRQRDRVNLGQARELSEQREAEGDMNPVPFITTENVPIILNAAGYGVLQKAAGEWYLAKFMELQTHKGTIRQMTSIQDVVSYTPTFTPN